MKKILLIFFFLFLYNISNEVVIKRENIKIRKYIKEKNIKNEINISKYLGYKYLWGGENLKTGIDCSAFVQLFYKNEFNILLPRTTFYQIKKGQKVDIKDIKMYDLMFFFNKKYTKVGHVAIYINGAILHSTKSKGTTIDSLNSNRYIKYFKPRLITIKRIKH